MAKTNPPTTLPPMIIPLLSGAGSELVGETEVVDEVAMEVVFTETEVAVREIVVVVARVVVLVTGTSEEELVGGVGSGVVDVELVGGVVEEFVPGKSVGITGPAWRL